MDLCRKEGFVEGCSTRARLLAWVVRCDETSGVSCGSRETKLEKGGFDSISSKSEARAACALSRNDGRRSNKSRSSGGSWDAASFWGGFESCDLVRRCSLAG
jgi:hypothetical protein